MTDFDPVPDTEDIRRRYRADTDTFGRVYDVILGTTSPTPYTEIAEIANCSSNTAKKHLDRLTEMGIVSTDRDSHPPRYKRNDGYLEWQEASRMATELSIDDIVTRVRVLEERRADYEDRFETTDPGSVAVFDGSDHESIHDRMAAVGNWHGVVRDIRLYELAHRIAQNDGRLLSA